MTEAPATSRSSSALDRPRLQALVERFSPREIRVPGPEVCENVLPLDEFDPCLRPSMGTGSRAGGGFDLASAKRVKGNGGNSVLEAGRAKGFGRIREIPHKVARPDEQMDAHKRLRHARRPTGRTLGTKGVRPPRFFEAFPRGRRHYEAPDCTARTGNEIVAPVGGREIHPIVVRVDGFYRLPAKKDLNKLGERQQRARDVALQSVQRAGALPIPNFVQAIGNSDRCTSCSCHFLALKVERE